MAHRQTNAQVTIGAEPYVAGDKVKAAFGKLVPYQYGMLPVLVVIQNDSGESHPAGRDAGRVRRPPRRPRERHARRRSQVYRAAPRPARLDRRPGRPSRVLSQEEPARRLGDRRPRLRRPDAAAGTTASGFLYFQTGLQRGATIYLSGLTEAATGKELFYFEIPLE